MKSYWKLVLFLLFGAMSYTAEAQTSYPIGVYMSISELQQKQPSQHYDLKMKKRSRGDIIMNGGNDYKPVSADKSIKRKVLREDILAIADSSGLYLNCFYHNCQVWYAKVLEEKDSVLNFKAAVPTWEANSKVGSASLFGGLIGGLIASNSMAKKRYDYQMTLSNGMVAFRKK